MSVTLQKTIADYVAAQGITARVTSAAHGITARDGWQHRAYRVRLDWDGRRATFDWSLGLAHPVMAHGEKIDAAPLFDALLSEYGTAVEYGALDADGDVTRAGDAGEFARDMGMPFDTRADMLAASRLLGRIATQSQRFATLAGGTDRLEAAAYLERL